MSKVYDSLDLCGGKLKIICEDDEDMLTIIFKNGKLIDVGFIEEEKAYYITVVADDTLESWNNPLKVIKINNKDDLLDSIQDMIYFCVKNSFRW